MPTLAPRSPMARDHAAPVRPSDPPADAGAPAVAAARRGAPEGIAALYRAHAGALLRVATRLTGSAADAEDVVHDVFVGLPELLRRYEDRGQLAAWLRGVTVRLVLDRLRRDRRRAALLVRAAPDAIAAAGHAGGHDGVDALDLDRALAALAEPLRVVFVLRQLEEWSFDEIGGRLGITPGAARVRHLRALRRLRTLLETGS